MSKYDNGYIVNPMSIKNIREYASVIRNSLQINDKENKYFPIVSFIELIMPRLDPQFCINIIPKEEMQGVHGLTCPEERCINIREDVYLGACNGNGRDRFTLAHELGHYLLHNKDNVKLARRDSGVPNKIYENSEWQADTFAAELLMPLDLIDNDNIFKISEEFGVSVTAASIRAKKIYKH